MFLLYMLSLFSLVSNFCYSSSHSLDTTLNNVNVSCCDTISLEDKSYSAFDNDTYTSVITNQEAYRYFSQTWEIPYINNDNYKRWYGINYLNSTTSVDYNSTISQNIVSMSSIGAMTDYLALNNIGYLVSQRTYAGPSSNVESYGMLFRFIFDYRLPIRNIEFTLTSNNMPNNRIYYGIGTFDHSGTYFNGIQNKSFLISFDGSLRNSEGVSSSIYRAYSFSEYYFYVAFSDPSNSFNISVNYLGSFDNQYQSGYDTGYSNGLTTGDSQGYQRGYDEGYSNGANVDSSIATIFTGILDVGLLPVNVFLSIFNFEIFGINVSGIVSGLLTFSIIIIIVRLLLGGKKDD